MDPIDRRNFLMMSSAAALGAAGGGAATSAATGATIESAHSAPVRRLWGQVFDFAEMKKIAAFARERGIAMHLDGARLFLAPAYTGVSVAKYAALFDTVYVSMWKYFNAGSGAILAGSAEMLDGLYHARRMFGGSLPRGWLFAAVADHYQHGFSERFADAVERSKAVFLLLESNPAITIDHRGCGTNVAKLKVTGVEPETFRKRLAAASINLSKPLEGGAGFKIQINETWRAQAPEAIAEALVRAAS